MMSTAVRRCVPMVLLALLAAGCTNNESFRAPTGGEIAIETQGTDEAAPTPTPIPPPTPTPVPIEFTLDETIALATADIEEFWAEELPIAYGLEFEPVQFVRPYFPSDETTVPACGGQMAPTELLIGNAFYCFPDDFIAFDNEILFPRLFEDFGSFTVALVLAHEYGHAVQGRANENGPTVNTELQADCFAGAWTRSLSTEQSEMSFFLRAGDLEDAIGGFLLFRDPVEASTVDPNAHGTAFDRVSAFAEGFRNGSERCTTFDTNPPVLENIPFTQADFDTGGNLPLDELIEPLVEPALNTFWTSIFDVFELGAFVTPTRAPFNSLGGSAAPCPSVVSELALTEIAYYCTAENTVAWDDGVLLPRLLSEVGDFAAAYPVMHAWSQAAMTQLGADTTGPGGVLAADCLTGAFAGAVFAGQISEPPISLSAGDLDEGVIGILQYAPATPDLSQTSMVADSPFDRVASFGDGFQRGLNACLPDIFN